MEIKDFILIMLVFIVLYLMYKITNLEKKNSTAEHFETSIDVAVNNRYTADMDAIRNLASLANNILTSKDSFQIPASKIYMKDVIISGSVDIENRDTLLLNILPKFMVIAWASTEIPLGWAPCDGKKYILDESGKYAIDTILGDLTPDLRGRFILGSGFGGKDENNNYLTEKKLGQIGGEEGHRLVENELARHTHKISWSNVGCYKGNCLGEGKMVATDSFYSGNADQMDWSDYTDPGRLPHETSTTGGVLRPLTGKKTDGADKDYTDPAVWEAAAHNNMPPYFVLTYIMKL